MADQKDIAELHNELRHIENKDAKFTEWEKKRLDTLRQILNAEPDLRKTLVALDARQKKEIEDLVQKQRREPSQTYGQHYADLEQRHDKERDRYISDHHAAKKIREDIDRRERTQTLEDTPKRTR